MALSILLVVLLLVMLAALTVLERRAGGRRVLQENTEAGVCIGGTERVIDEFRLLQDPQPKASPLPIASTGEAAPGVATELSKLSDDFQTQL